MQKFRNEVPGRTYDPNDEEFYITTNLVIFADHLSVDRTDCYRKLQWIKYEVKVEETVNAYIILLGKPLGKRPLR
jgi:hypothetical protein